MQLCDVSNLLIQKWPAPEFQVTSKLDLSGMKDGDVCGMISLGGRYDSVAVEQREGQKCFVRRTGQWTANDEVEEILGKVPGDVIYLRMKVEEETYVSYDYSLGGEFIPLGGKTEATAGRWVGVKVGLYAIHEGEGEGGSLKADYFVFQPLGE